MSESVGFGANRIIIATPACEQPASVEWGINLSGMRWPLNCSIEFSSQDGTGTEDPDVLRNYVAGYALATKARYVWFLQNHVLPPSWASTRMIEAMRSDPSIMVCAAMSLTNVPEETDFKGVISKFTDGHDQWEILEVSEGHQVGLECTIVRTEVFDKIDEPWFKEGVNFCEKVQKVGYKVVAHTGVLCGYVDMKLGRPVWPPEAVYNPDDVIAK